MDRQRGDGVFQRSIDGLQRLNALGYGQPGSRAWRCTWSTTRGAVLPPEQGRLEADYKRELHARHGITFNRLFALTNMPIKRFGSTLVSKGQFGDYMDLLKDSFHPAQPGQVMCRDLISVDWQGRSVRLRLQPACSACGRLDGGHRPHPGSPDATLTRTCATCCGTSLPAPPIAWPTTATAAPPARAAVAAARWPLSRRTGRLRP